MVWVQLFKNKHTMTKIRIIRSKKYFLLLIAISGILFLSGCKTTKPQHRTKYGPPSTQFKKMNHIENLTLAENKEVVKL